MFSVKQNVFVVAETVFAVSWNVSFMRTETSLCCSSLVLSSVWCSASVQIFVEWMSNWLNEWVDSSISYFREAFDLLLPVLMDKTNKYKQSVYLSLVTCKRAVYLCSWHIYSILFFFISNNKDIIISFSDGRNCLRIGWQNSEKFKKFH